MSSIQLFAPAVSFLTLSSIYYSFSSLLNESVSHCYSAASFMSDHKLRNLPRATTLSAYDPLLPPFADDVVVWTALPITNTCPLDVVKSFVLE